MYSKSPLIIAFTYLIFGYAWIIASDLMMFGPDEMTSEARLVGIGKGLLFVTLSAALIYFLTGTLFRQASKIRIRTQRLFDHVPIGFILTDEGGKIKKISTNILDELNFKEEELSGVSIARIVPKEEFKRLQKELDLVSVQDLQRFRIETKLKSRSGELHNYEMNGILINDGGTFEWATTALNIDDRKEKERDLAKQNMKMMKLQNRRISAQLNPHFIFNGLNSIQNYILDSDPEPALNYTSAFARLMRKTLENSQHDFISIAEEVDFLTQYLEIENERMNTSFAWEINLDDDCLKDNVVPPMLVQPYLENAVIHGIGPLEDRKGRISVGFKHIGDNICITISDNGIGRDKSKPSFRKVRSDELHPHRSLGMDLTKSRLDILSHLTGKEFTFSIEDIKGNNNEPLGTKVELRVPILDP